MLITMGKKLAEIGRADLEGLVLDYDKTILDIGAGSGKFVYKSAKDNPQMFFIGLETSQDSLLDYARRIVKKPARGGLPNVMYVLGSIESPPVELEGMADEVFINYPWTRLLKALVTGERNILEKTHSFFRHEGILCITISYDKRYEARFIEEYDLPELSEEYIRGEMSPAYENNGFALETVEILGPDEMKKELSAWGKKLAFSRERTAWRMRYITRC